MYHTKILIHQYVKWEILGDAICMYSGSSNRAYMCLKKDPFQFEVHKPKTALISGTALLKVE